MDLLDLEINLTLNILLCSCGYTGGQLCRAITLCACHKINAIEHTWVEPLRSATRKLLGTENWHLNKKQKPTKQVLRKGRIEITNYYLNHHTSSLILIQMRNTCQWIKELIHGVSVPSHIYN